VQVLADRPTGAVDVQLKDGQPTYIFRADVAWDFLEATKIAGEKLREADAVVFGTLAQRNIVSRHTIRELVTNTPSDCLRVFDVNLRPPFYADEVICASILMANVLKLNDAELPVVLAAIETAPGTDGPAHLFSKYPGLNVIAVTRGEHCSTVYARNRPGGHTLPAKQVAVQDTVGAGDAFTAAVIAGLLRGTALEAWHEHAVEMAAYVCSHPGATPRIPAELANL
jgi:fructokinase